MAWRIVRQPNGLLACFSDVVDNFTALEMNRAEALAECLQNGCKPMDAYEKLRRGETDEPVPGFVERTADDGLDRWRDCLETIREVHGEAEVRNVLAMIS